MKTIKLAGLLLSLAATLYSTTAAAQYHRHDRYSGYGGYSRNYNFHHSYDRDYGYAYHRPYYYSPNYYRPRVGVSVVANIPFGAVMLHLGGTPYHYYRGTFYRPYGPRFIITAPPVGIVVPLLPPDCSPVIIDGRNCYTYSGTYYQPLGGNQGYQVIEGPQQEQQQQPSAPADDDTVADSSYEKLVIDGKTYYKKGTTFYKAIVSDSGEVTYEAVGQSVK